MDLKMYCCMSARSSVNYLPPGVAPLIPVNKRKYRSVRFSHDTEIEQEEKLQFRAGNFK